MRNPRDAGGGQLIHPALDVTDPASIQAAVAEVLDRFGPIDVLVNNAGYGAYGPLEAFSAEQIQRQFATNVGGLLAVTQAVLPGMRERRSGTIINISSIGGLFALPLFSLYHGTKWAVEGISESLTFELAPLGIRVRIVEPGAIATEFAGSSADTGDLPVPSDYADFVERAVASRGAGTRSAPDLAADVIFAAATDESDRLRYLVGEDAEQIAALRAAMGAAGTMAAVRERYGL